MADNSDRAKLAKVGFLKKADPIVDELTIEKSSPKAKSRWGKAITGVRAVRLFSKVVRHFRANKR